MGQAGVAPAQPLHAAAADRDGVPRAVAVREGVPRRAQQPRPQSIHLPHTSRLVLTHPTRFLVTMYRLPEALASWQLACACCLQSQQLAEITF